MSANDIISKIAHPRQNQTVREPRFLSLFTVRCRFFELRKTDDDGVKIEYSDESRVKIRLRSRRARAPLHTHTLKKNASTVFFMFVCVPRTNGVILDFRKICQSRWRRQLLPHEQKKKTHVCACATDDSCAHPHTLPTCSRVENCHLFFFVFAWWGNVVR